MLEHAPVMWMDTWCCVLYDVLNVVLEAIDCNTKWFGLEQFWSEQNWDIDEDGNAIGESHFFVGT